jgi:hypothetical protein
MQMVRPEDAHYLGFLSASTGTVYVRCVFHNANGSIIGLTAPPSSWGGGSGLIACGPGNIGDAMPVGTAYYVITLARVSDFALVSKPYAFRIDNTCYKAPRRFWALNKFGAIDAYTFTGYESRMNSNARSVVTRPTMPAVVGDRRGSWQMRTWANAPRRGYAITSQTMGKAMLRFADNPNDATAVAVIAADPEYVGTLRTTCVATLLSGGHAENALPQLATATVNCRIFPGVAVESVRARIAEVIADPQAKVTEVGKAFASDASPLRDDVVQAVRKAVDANFKGLPVVPGMSSGATDSLYFRAAGIPSYGVSGAYVRPEDDYSHGLNERVPVSTVARGLKHWHVLVTELAK